MKIIYEEKANHMLTPAQHQRLEAIERQPTYTHNTFAVFTYAAVVTKLQQGLPVLTSWLSLLQWRELSFYMPLQFESGMVYAAVLSTPGFEPLSCEANATQAADRMIDERMDSLKMKRGE